MTCGCIFSIILASFFSYGTKDSVQESRVAEHNAGYFPARDSVLPVFTQLIAMQHWCANCRKLCASNTHLREYCRCLNRMLAVARHCGQTSTSPKSWNSSCRNCSVTAHRPAVCVCSLPVPNCDVQCVCSLTATKNRLMILVCRHL